MAEQTQDVVLAAVRDSAGRYLVSLRHEHLAGGAHWEFPGGKVEPGETLRQALSRELMEEVNLNIDQVSFLRRWRAPPGCKPALVLHLFEVSGWTGQMHHNEGQDVQWCFPEQIAALKILPGSLALLDCLRLAPVLCITPEWSPAQFDDALAGAIVDKLKRTAAATGERVQLLWRQPHWSPAQQIAALTPLAQQCRQARITLAVARSAEVARACRADYLHLSSAQLTADARDISSPTAGTRESEGLTDDNRDSGTMTAGNRDIRSLTDRNRDSGTMTNNNRDNGTMTNDNRDNSSLTDRNQGFGTMTAGNQDIGSLPTDERDSTGLAYGNRGSGGLACGAAVHCEEELECARSLSVRYALISPVHTTPSKPQALVLGWEGFADMARQFEGLSYALGSIGPTDLDRVRELGGFGIAGIRLWWD